MMYERILGFYKEKFWNKKMVWDVAKNNVLTPTEYSLIVGEKFDPNKPPSESWYGNE